MGCKNLSSELIHAESAALIISIRIVQPFLLLQLHT